MELTALFTEEDAASQVIGVILMVAVVVVLAAIIGTYVIGVGAGQAEGEPAPATRFVFDHDPSANELTIEHDGGDTVERDRISFNVVGESVTVASDFPESEVEVDDTAILSGIERDDVVQVFWTTPDSEEKRQLLGTWEGPDSD